VAVLNYKRVDLD